MEKTSQGGVVPLNHLQFSFVLGHILCGLGFARSADSGGAIRPGEKSPFERFVGVLDSMAPHIPLGLSDGSPQFIRVISYM
jgi:hypothetical protein